MNTSDDGSEVQVEVEGRGEEKEKERWRGEEIPADSGHVLCKQTQPPHKLGDTTQQSINDDGSHLDRRESQFCGLMLQNNPYDRDLIGYC